MELQAESQPVEFRRQLQFPQVLVMSRVLVIGDELKLRMNLRQLLEREGMEVVAVDSGVDGYHLAMTEPIDLVVLDLNLQGCDGLETMVELRRDGFIGPILILTARDSIDDRVLGLERGADDYLVKPFAHAELVARIRALLRRFEPREMRLLRCRDLELDLLLRRVTRGDVEIDLTQREFDLLAYLVLKKNSDVSREMLARDVWKEPAGVLTNAIDVCVNGLRKKVEFPGMQLIIETVRGVGYAVRDHE